MTSAYGHKQTVITNLTNVTMNPTTYTTTFYNYKNVNFLAKIRSKSKSKYLVFMFHGSLFKVMNNKRGVERITFRGFDYNINDTDIICLSDGLVNIYKECDINWGLSSVKHDLNKIYLEIFGYFIESDKYRNVVFTGTSAGGFPAIRYAAYFNKISLTSNSQLYLENYSLFKLGRIKANDGRMGLCDVMERNNDTICYVDKNITQYITKSQPSKIILYNNTMDVTYTRHTIPFIEFIKENNLKNILDLHLFKGGISSQRNWTPHQIQFPSGKRHLHVLVELINELDNIL